MILYTIIMFAVAVLFFFLGRSIYRGNTDLIHDYHQTKVKDKAAYGKAMFTMAAAMAASGLVAMFDDGFLPVLVLFLGLAVGIIQIILAQKKFNNGVF